MTRYFIFTVIFFALLMAKPITTLAGTNNESGHVKNNHHNEEAGKTGNTGHYPMGAKSHHGGEKAHSNVPSWDELAHIHHFHHNRMKKIRRHFSKYVFLSRLFLFICHAAILIVSYLHVTH